MRRLPVYFLLDTSGSMYGEPIEALNNALRGMISVLRSDPQALETLWLSIITFNREVTELVPLTELADFRLPEIVCPQSGPTHTGQALEMLYHKVSADLRRGSATQKGDWRPLLFLITDGKPSDVFLYRSMIPQIKSLNFAAIVGCLTMPCCSSSPIRWCTLKRPTALPLNSFLPGYQTPLSRATKAPVPQAASVCRLRLPKFIW
jgi:uncharacterized protein YegL